MKGQRLGLKVLLNLLIAVSVGFSTAATANGMSITEPMTAQQIRGLDADGLENLNAHIGAIMRDIMNHYRGKSTMIDLRAKIQMLGNYEVESCFKFLHWVARLELKRLGSKSPAGSKENLFITIDTMAKIATQTPFSNVEEFKDLANEVAGQLVKYQFANEAAERMNNLWKAMSSRSTALVDLDALLQELNGSSAGVKRRLDKIRTILESRVIGQPEVVEALLDLEWRNELYGANRTTPDAIYLMGMPGTGKDTAAEAFTDALHNRSGAYKRHMFRMPVMKHQPDLWQVFGSATGYIGSENFPPFLAFLVQHSNGQYKVEPADEKKGTFRIVNNPEYKGETLEGYYPANVGVVFVNEFHNWSKQLKDDVLKQALEKGYFPINNPNGGLSELYVPVRFIIASNEGIGLTTAREANGQRMGKPMTYEQIVKKWADVHENKKVLKNEILATNGARNGGMRDNSTPGISEELLNRIPDRFIKLMRPLSPGDLQDIVSLALTEMSNKLAGGSNVLGKVELNWDQNLVQFIQEYGYVAEDNARPVKDRIVNLIEEPLMDAIKSDSLTNLKQDKTTIHLSVAPNADRTYDLIVRAQGKELRQPIRTTFKDRPAAPISDAKIEELADLEKEMKANVFGVDSILERLSQRVVSIANEAASGTTRPANLILLSGLSSTGKTETAKQLSQKLSGSDDELVTFDFSQIQSVHDFKTRILGLKDGLGNPVPSDFMKHYDRNNGRMIVAFDELANVRDQDLLKMLYDLFREPVVSTFSDGKPRPMGGVMIIITGNAGQELYNNVPRHVPMEVQMAAWQEIFEQTNKDYELQRRILEKYYPEPLITRIGRNNIFFMPPHSYKSLRQLAQLKLSSSLKRIALTESRRGWSIGFASAKDYSEFLDTVVDEGFTLRYQGASIDSFVRDDFEEPIKYLLLKNKAPSGAKVTLQFQERTDNSNEDVPGHVIFRVQVEGLKDSLELKIRRLYVEKPVKHNETNHLITAYHEAGHSVVRQALFKDAYTGTKLTIIPGVALIGGEWIYYAGVAQSLQERELATIREWVIRQIAVLAAGESAERLVSRGETHSTGKLNDMERATRLARDSIVRYGLSKKWGTHAVPTGQSTEDYVASLSDKQKTLLESETMALIEEGRALALTTLELNFESALLPLGALLAEKGELDQEDIRQFYATHKLTAPEDVSSWKQMVERAKTKWRKLRNPKTSATEVEIDPNVPKPAKMANLKNIVEERKRRQYEDVSIPADAPIRGCEELLGGALKQAQ